MAKLRDLGVIFAQRPPGVARRVALFVLTAGVATAGIIAAVLDQRARDEAETALWTVSGPPCQRIAPIALKGPTGGAPTPLSFQDAQGAFVDGGVYCNVIDHSQGRQTRPFTVCQFGWPKVVRLDTPHGEVFFKAPVRQSVTISFAGGDPHCVLVSNFPTAFWRG